VSVGDEVLLETDAASDNLNPVFEGKGANYEIASDSQLVVEIRDADALKDFNMGRAVVPAPSRTEIDLGQMEIDTGNRGSVVIEVERAHALMGLGFDYNLWGNKLTVTEVWKHSPAARGGMRPGDKVLQIGAREVGEMQTREVRSALNAIGHKKIDLVVQHKSGTTATVPINVGPIYPLVDEYGPID
jgi:C-terminal processing protease CtpA/Prc